jgi:hypothetical protein
MLLRSELVFGWPGLQVIATAAAAAVNTLRIDRVAPNVLLVLWETIPDTVTLSQPQQGVAYGVVDGAIALRNLTNELGKPTGATYPIGRFYRVTPPGDNIGHQVLKLVPPTPGAPDYLIPGLQSAINQSRLLTPAQFAIEMVNSPQQIQFKLPQAQR